MLRPTRVEIDLNNIGSNVEIIRSALTPETKYLAVIKANAYGHGAVKVADYLEQRKMADYFAVAIVEEGIQLRENGNKLPILVLGPSQPAYAHEIVQYDLTPAVFTTEMLLALDHAAKAAGKKCRFHFKIDSGMNRIGFKSHETFLNALETLKKCESLVFEGIFTHFAVAEIEDPSFTDQQIKTFLSYVELARTAGYSPIVHCANSAGILMRPYSHYDMVRGGIAMYGYHPTGKFMPESGLKPVLTFKTQIAYLKTILPGETVSYGRRFTAEKSTLVATLPVGYGDGYKRLLSGKASVLIHGKRAPLIGSICMDQCMCDVSDIPNVKIGDEVVLIGQQGEEAVSADELADLVGTISYEILLSISERVPRIYV